MTFNIIWCTEPFEAQISHMQRRWSTGWCHSWSSIQQTTTNIHFNSANNNKYSLNVTKKTWMMLPNATTVKTE